MKLSNFYIISAIGKVLAAELPNLGNAKCTVLYPASAKASTEIGECWKYMFPSLSFFNFQSDIYRFSVGERKIDAKNIMQLEMIN